MIKALYTVAQRMHGKNNPMWKYVYKLNKLLVNLFYSCSQLFNKKFGIDANSNVVISLTSYPARNNVVGTTIQTLLNQTYKPRSVVLYLSKEQYPNGRDSLPKKLFKLERRGLDIKFVDGDLKPHKKYFYAFQEYPDSIIITADDDIFYPENHIENLVKASKKYPEAVICNRSHKIQFKDIAKGEFDEYKNWKDNKTNEPDIATIPIGCNGILYRPKMFVEELYNQEAITKYSLYTDDLWLKAMELKSGIKAFNCSDEPLVYFDNVRSHSTGLWHSNASDEENRNDVVWNMIIECYPEVKNILLDRQRG